MYYVDSMTDEERKANQKALDNAIYTTTQSKGYVFYKLN